MKFIIKGVYLPLTCPASIYDSYIASVDFIVRQYPNHFCICRGDFNISKIIWSNDDSDLLYSSNLIICFPCTPEIFGFHGFC